MNSLGKIEPVNDFQSGVIAKFDIRHRITGSIYILDAAYLAF